MFVILEGSVEVRSGGNVIAELGSGTIFGETALITEVPRTADVVAQNDVEVLILTQEVLKKAMISMQPIMIKVMFNLSIILAERLREATEKLGAQTATPAKAAPAKAAPAKAAPPKATPK